MQVGVPCEFYVFYIYVDSLNDQFLPIDSVIDVNLDLPIEYDLIKHRFENFGVDESLLVDSTKVTYIVDDLEVDDTHIEVTMNRSNSINVLHTMMVLFFLR